MGLEPLPNNAYKLLHALLTIRVESSQSLVNGSTRKLGDGRTSVPVENSKEGRCVVSLDVGHRATSGLLWGRVVLVSLLRTGRKRQMQGVGILHAC